MAENKSSITIIKLFKYSLLILLLAFSGKLYSESYVDTYINKKTDEVNNPPSIELDKIEDGQLLRILWLDIPIYIYRRTAHDLEQLKKSNETLLADPNDGNAEDSVSFRYFSSTSKVHAQVYTAGLNMIKGQKLRSVNHRFLVIGGLDPVSSCSLIYNTKNEVRFYDPCSSRSYDAAGRLYKKNNKDEVVDEQLFNLRTVPYFKKDDNLMSLGLKEGYKALPKIKFDYKERYSPKTPSQQLAAAALFNDKKTVLNMLEKGADIEYFNGSWPPSPLISAILGSDLDIVSLLLERGAVVTSIAIEQAALHKREDVIQLLLKNSDW